MSGIPNATDSPPSGGSAAIYGFLYQLLGTSARLVGAVTIGEPGHTDPETVTAVLEPRAGGDLQIQGAIRVCIQFKHRSETINVGTLIDQVLTDLFRAHCSSPCDRYELQCSAGLSQPALDLLGRLQGSLEQRADVEHNLQRLRERCQPIYGASFPAGDRFNEEFRVFCSRFSVGERLNLDAARRSLGRWLHQHLPYVDRIEDEIDRLTGNLLRRAATNDAVVTATELLEILRVSGVIAVTPEGANETVRARLEEAIAARHFQLELDVRKAVTPSADDPITLLSGPSGRGKTWGLCRVGAEFLAADIPAIFISAPTLALVQDQLRRQIAVEALGQESPIYPSAIGRVWRRFHRDPAATLWVLWEGCRDPAELEGLQLNNGLGEGLRLVAELPPNATLTGTALAVAPTHPVVDFTQGEVFDALRRRGINAALVPHAISQMLRLPVLCGIYSSLATELSDWNPENEYLVLEEFWSRARRRIGSLASHRLKALAGQMMGRRRARLDDADLVSLGFTDATLPGYVNAGWLSHIDEKWSFAHERLLIWALAESLVDQFDNGSLGAPELAGTIRDLERGHDDKSRLQRLGFLLMDVVWLVLRRGASPERAAALLAALEGDADTPGRVLYRELLPTVGAQCAPALVARLRAEPAHAPYLGLPGDIATCLLDLRLSDADRATTIDRLAAITTPAGRTTLLLLGADWPLQAQRETMWTEYVELSRTQRGADFDSERFGYLEAALGTVTAERPEWLELKLRVPDDAEALWLAVHLLRRLPNGVGFPIWLRVSDGLFAAMPEDRHNVLYDCIGQFRDLARIRQLANCSRTTPILGGQSLAHLSDLDPALAMEVIREVPPIRYLPYGRLWIDRLLDHDPVRATNDLSAWLLARDPSGGDFEQVWSRVPERLEPSTVDRLLELLDEVSAGGWDAEDSSANALLALLGQRALNPRYESVFAKWRTHALATRLFDRLVASGEGQRDEAANWARTVLRRIGGPSYGALVEHLLARPLNMCLPGIRESLQVPSAAVVARLEVLADDWTTDCQEEVRIELWRALLALAPDRWYPRTVELLRESEPFRIHLGIFLLKEGGFDDVEPDVLACVASSAPGSRTEALAMSFALDIGDGDEELFARGRRRFQLLEDDNDGRIACFNAMLKDRSPEGRGLLDTYLLSVASTTSFRSFDMSLLSCRLRQDDVGDELLKAGERMMHRHGLFGEDFVDAYLERSPEAARNVLLDRAFAPADIFTEEQPKAIRLLAGLDSDLATQAFARAWVARPDRRQYLARVARDIGSATLPSFVDNLDEDARRQNNAHGFRNACIEMRRQHDDARPLLVSAFSEADSSRRAVLAEAIGWLPGSEKILSEIERSDPETDVRQVAYEVRASWNARRGAVEAYRVDPGSLSSMEYAIEMVDPAILCNFDDEWGLITLIQSDTRLTMIAEARFTRRYNEETGSRLKRVRLRPRERPMPNPAP